MEAECAAAEQIGKANVGLKVFHALKENRLEVAVMTLLLYSVGVIDKAITYGTGICV